MVAAANKALSATADGNQKKPVFPGFIPLGASPQATAAALAARPMPDVAQGTGLGMGDPMKSLPTLAPAVGGGLAPAFNSGLVGENARYNALPQDNAKNAGRVGAADVPIQASKMGWNDIPPLRAPEGARNIYANMGMDDLKQRANLTGVQATTQAPAPQATGTRGLSGLVGSTNDIMPRTRTVMSQSGQSISNLVNNGQYGAAAGEAVRGAAAMFPAVGLDVIAPLAPMGQGMVNATHQYATGESPAVTQAAAPAKTSAPTPTPVSTQPPLRVQEQAAANAATIAAAPQRNAAGALTSLGAGTDVVGAGIKKYVVDGKTLYSNMGDDGPGGNLSLMNRGAPTAQNMAAMDAMVGRSTAEGAQAVQRAQFNDQVAQAKAINALPTADSNPNDLRDPANIAARNRLMDMQMKSGESPQAYGVRVHAMAEAQRLAATQGNANADRGLKRDELTANQQIAQSKLGIDQQQLGLKQQQVGNELATGAQSRDAKGMEIAASKQLQSLRDRFMAATGAEQEALGKQLLTMSLKEPKSSMKENFMVVGGGQEWDAQANSMRNVPQTLIDLRTGKPVGGDVGGAKAPTTAVDFLKKNPSQAQAFKDKYGYLPEGFKQ